MRSVTTACHFVSSISGTFFSDFISSLTDVHRLNVLIGYFVASAFAL